MRGTKQSSCVVFALVKRVKKITLKEQTTLPAIASLHIRFSLVRRLVRRIASFLAMTIRVMPANVGSTWRNRVMSATPVSCRLPVPALLRIPHTRITDAKTVSTGCFTAFAMTAKKNAAAFSLVSQQAPNNSSPQSSKHPSAPASCARQVQASRAL